MHHTSDHINFKHYVFLLLKSLKLILPIMAIAMVITYIYSSQQPKEYSAGVTFFIKQPGNAGNSLLNNLGFGGAGGGGKITVPFLIKLANSRRIQDLMIEEFKLEEHYDAPNTRLARLKLSGNTSISVYKKSGIMKLSVADKSPQMAATLANAYIKNIQSLNKTLYIVPEKDFLQVIDPAIPPTLQFKPRVVFNSFLVGIFIFALGIFATIFLNFIATLLKADNE